MRSAFHKGKTRYVFTRCNKQKYTALTSETALDWMLNYYHVKHKRPISVSAMVVITIQTIIQQTLPSSLCSTFLAQLHQKKEGELHLRPQPIIERLKHRVNTLVHLESLWRTRRSILVLAPPIGWPIPWAVCCRPSCCWRAFACCFELLSLWGGLWAFLFLDLRLSAAASRWIFVCLLYTC